MGFVESVIRTICCERSIFLQLHKVTKNLKSIRWLEAYSQSV